MSSPWRLIAVFPLLNNSGQIHRLSHASKMARALTRGARNIIQGQMRHLAVELRAGQAGGRGVSYWGKEGRSEGAAWCSRLAPCALLLKA